MAERFVGLDIGTSAIRVAEVTVSEGARPVLECYGQVGLHPGTVVDGEVRDQQAVVDALRRLWHDGGFTGKKVHLGVAGLRAITRESDMPPLPPDELDGAVRFQADQVVPFPLEETAMSSKVIAQYTNAEGAPQIRVLVAAAHRDMIDAAVSATQEAGLEPIGIDLNTAALARALYDPSFSHGPETIVSVGAGLTMVVVHQAGQLQFVRTIDLGGNNVTRAIASALDLPMADAEAVKRRLGEPGIHDERAESAAGAAVDELVGEIQNSIRFFASLPGRAAPARLLVTGGGARAAGFLPKLAEGIEIPVVPASPLSMIDSRLPITPEEAAAINPTLAVPVGLALPDPQGRPFNLLPREILAGYVTKRMRRVLIGAVALVAVILIALVVIQILRVHHAENGIASLTAEVQTIKNNQIPKYNKAVALGNAVKAKQSSLLPLIANEVDWLVVYNEVSSSLPSTATFNSMVLTATAQTKSTSGTATAPVTTKGYPVIGSGTASVTVPNLAEFTAFGNAMTQAPGFTLGPPTGTLTTGSSITFSIVFNINALAKSRRLTLFPTATTASTPTKSASSASTTTTTKP